MSVSAYVSTTYKKFQKSLFSLQVSLIILSKKYYPVSANKLTLISISPIFAVDLKMGRPTRDGNMCAGKLDPAYPVFTN